MFGTHCYTFRPYNGYVVDTLILFVELITEWMSISDQVD